MIYLILGYPSDGPIVSLSAYFLEKPMQTLILYSKSGCHLCEGLQEKLEQIQSQQDSDLLFELEIRDIAQKEQWLQAYQYEVPVLFYLKQENDNIEMPIPRPSPRLNARQLAQFLQPYLRSPL
jgi:Glutaredoxin-like domain (DUF836)